MKIAVISDSHDHVDNLRKVLTAVQGTDALIHCGDLVAPFMINELGDHYKLPIHLIWGNVKGDTELATKNRQTFQNISLHGDEGQFQHDGKKIAFTHYPERAEELAKSGQFNLVCYGHTHKAETHQVGKALVVNPGDVMGRFDNKAHYALYDVQTSHVSLEAIESSPA